MKANNLFLWSYTLLLSAMLAIGRIYDERLEILGINLSLIISVTYIVFSIFLLFSIKDLRITKTKILLYVFYFLVISITPILWLVYGVIEYGFLKYLNYILIVIPISVIIVEKFSYEDVTRLLIALLAVSTFLAMLALAGQAISANNDSGRLSVLGGGPIIFSRWLGLGILILTFMPALKRYKIRFPIIIIFILLSIASGSRGPVLSLFLVFSLFLFLNFRKYFIKFLIFSTFLAGLLLFTGVSKEIEKLGRVERILMNFTPRGIAMKSTTTRENLIDGALTVFVKYPLGVGAGNWQNKANEIKPNHLMPLEYSHNIFLEVLNEFSVIALLVLILLFVYVFHLSYILMQNNSMNKSSLYPLIFYALTYFFINSLVSGDINDSRLLFVMISFLVVKSPLIEKSDKLC